jgi:hypothetical protein
MIERLVFVRPHLSRDRLVPFLGVVEDRIDIEHDAAERKNPVPQNLADLVFRCTRIVHSIGKISHDERRCQGLFSALRTTLRAVQRTPRNVANTVHSP